MNRVEIKRYKSHDLLVSAVTALTRECLLTVKHQSLDPISSSKILKTNGLAFNSSNDYTTAHH